MERRSYEFFNWLDDSFHHGISSTLWKRGPPRIGSLRASPFRRKPKRFGFCSWDGEASVICTISSFFVSSRNYGLRVFTQEQRSTRPTDKDWRSAIYFDLTSTCSRCNYHRWNFSKPLVPTISHMNGSPSPSQVYLATKCGKVWEPWWGLREKKDGSSSIFPAWPTLMVTA